jgi:hypothetical protein
MPTREQLHQDVDAVPDDQLDSAQVVVLDSDGDQLGQPIESLSREGGTVEEEQIPTLEESIAILASVDFPPREEAWR